MGMFAVLIGYMFVASFFPVWMGWVGIFFLAGAVFAGLTIYLYHEKIYNEQKQKVSRFRGFSHINLFSLQYIGTLRAKRVRTMVIMITAIFLSMPISLPCSRQKRDRNGDKVAMTTLYVAGAILLPSVVLSQWTFGIEANFFHGLMTKPVKVKQMLQNCFYYYMVVSAVALLLTLPFLSCRQESESRCLSAVSVWQYSSISSICLRHSSLPVWRYSRLPCSACRERI